MMHYLRGLLAERRAAMEAGPVPDDVFTRLIRTTLPAEVDVGDERILINMAGLPLGFVESGPGAMVEAVEQIMLRPQVRAEAVDAAADPDPARFDRYVWEALRFSPFFKLLPRVCERDHVLAAAPRAGRSSPRGRSCSPPRPRPCSTRTWWRSRTISAPAGWSTTGCTSVTAITRASACTPPEPSSAKSCAACSCAPGCACSRRRTE
ncbi:hypothetical protein ACFQX6_02570 [Streptosporangium lutulentum]